MKTGHHGKAVTVDPPSLLPTPLPMYAHAMSFPSAFFHATPRRRLLTPSVWPPMKNRRESRAIRRRTVTRRSIRSFNRFYDRLLASRRKILYTRSLATFRLA